MKNRQLFTMKFKSSRLKEFDYDIQITPQQAVENGEMISLFDNEILRVIRRITGHKIDYGLLNNWHRKRDQIKIKPHSKDNIESIKKYQSKILDMLFIPEYITIVMDHNAHYKYLFSNGLMLNSERYVRLSSSASQSRVSTVVFCQEKIIDKVNKILDNGRDKSKKLCPSKFNAYKGLAGSSTKIVSPPRFCVVPDYITTNKVEVNLVTEVDGDADDEIDIREVDIEFNRFDGQGLIKPEMAKKWANELGLDYIPGQWCIRQNFLKGMLCTFDIDKFCRERNNSNYLIDTIYKDGNGNPIKADLREIDVIISESQLKLWDSYNSIEEYIDNCKKNELSWGVVLTSPKEPSDILKMNYQFLQTLNLSKSDIKNICSKFVDWVEGVNFDDIYYTFLFLLGTNFNNKDIKDYFKNSDNYWLKSLIINHDIRNDKYIRDKVYRYIENIIKRGSLGEIILDGNFQVLVSDPYAMMQFVCGHEKIDGLLGSKEYYCNYWNKRNVKKVNSMRPPLTFRSEHVILNLTDSPDHSQWYGYCEDAGMIVNIHGHETLNWSGSDYDFDIIATTSNETVINAVYTDELPVVYETPKSNVKVLKEEDLYNADLFAFGSIIGSITNKSTSAYALLPLFDKESEEYKTLINRLKMCTKLQSAQIDKAKIGREVKGIPNIWVQRKKIDRKDKKEVKKKKEFLNRILLDRHPYFFIYLYKDTYYKYKRYVTNSDISSQQKLGLTLDELLNKKGFSKEQKSFVEAYHRFLPVIDSDSVMNTLCKHIEDVDFNIREKLKYEISDSIYELYIDKSIPKNNEIFELVLSEHKSFMQEMRNLYRVGANQINNTEQYDENTEKIVNDVYNSFKDRMFGICSNAYELTNYLVEVFYLHSRSSNKDILWNSFGEYIFENIKKQNKESVLFPFPSDNGDLEYLNNRYELREVIV